MWPSGGLALALSLAGAPRPADAPRLREAGAVRRCLAAPVRLALEPCREALAAGVRPARASSVRRALARSLLELGRFEEALELAREWSEAQPEDPDARLQLASALLYLGGRPAEAVAAVRGALALRPDDAAAFALLGLSLNGLDQHPEATAAFGEAERLEPGYFEHRPAARAAYEASQRGARWP